MAILRHRSSTLFAEPLRAPGPHRLQPECPSVRAVIGTILNRILERHQRRPILVIGFDFPAAAKSSGSGFGLSLNRAPFGHQHGLP